MPAGGLVTAFNDSNLMGKGIVFVQLVMSIFTWGLMIGKGNQLRNMKRGCADFGRTFARDVEDVMGLYLSSRNREDSPFNTIYQKTCERLIKFFDRDRRTAMIAAKSSGNVGEPITAKEIDLICGTAEHALAEQILDVEKGMSSLATMSTAAPLIGLLGTVWGMLSAFQCFGADSTGQLAAMAPAISAAMLTTVTGLFVAIPSGIGYNMLYGKVREINIELEGFVDELTGRMAYEFQGKGD